VAIPKSSLVSSRLWHQWLSSLLGANESTLWFTAEAGVVIRTQWKLIIYACIVSDLPLAPVIFKFGQF